MEIRSDWTMEEIRLLYDKPLFELILQGARLHRKYHSPNEMQVCSLISIKTGGCPEDCKYCPQSSHYETDVSSQAMMEVDEIMERADWAIANGASRICLGMAIRSVREGPQFERVLDVVRQITSRGVEVCCTLGMLNDSQAEQLKKAGLHSYNHNLDTSRNYYSSVITTRTYEDRLKTLDTVEKAGMHVCTGGIIGLNESIEDRISMIHTLATRRPHPASIPINILIRTKGTPFENNQKVPIWDVVRMIATARITMPKSIVRFTAGRLDRSWEEQALCFLAGANSMFLGDVLLTRPNPKPDDDLAMLECFGLTPKRVF